MKVGHCVACKSKNIRSVMSIKDHSISGEIFSVAQCSDCGFRFTDDPPVEAECGKYYKSENYVSHSDTTTGFINSVYHKVRQIMLDRKSSLLSSLSSKKTLLDVGSGTGYFPAHMKEKGYDVTAVEVDDEARKYSIKKFGLKVFPPSDLLGGKISGPFSFISLWHVLEHLYDPDEYMQRFNLLLERDGHLIVAVPNHLCADADKYKEYWAGYDVPRHLWHFTPNSMEILAKRNGFTIVKKEGMPFDPFYVSMLSEKYKGSAFGLLRGSVTGMNSLLKGWQNPDAASSVIYVMRKSDSH